MYFAIVFLQFIFGAVLDVCFAAVF